jgi:hypothetical protein
MAAEMIALVMNGMEGMGHQAGLPRAWTIVGFVMVPAWIAATILYFRQRRRAAGYFSDEQGDLKC